MTLDNRSKYDKMAESYRSEQEKQTLKDTAEDMQRSIDSLTYANRSLYQELQNFKAMVQKLLKKTGELESTVKKLTQERNAFRDAAGIKEEPGINLSPEDFKLMKDMGIKF